MDLIISACKKFEGDHDFANFCKKDPAAEDLSLVRSLYSFDVELVQENKEDDSLNVYVAIIKGKSFLWHMVRCMMEILFLIGKEVEKTEVID